MDALRCSSRPAERSTRACIPGASGGISVTAPVLPKLVATSVVRGSEKGQSHGGVYLIDFASQQVEQKIDWNTGEIDFAGRGWDRGLRGIEFTDDAIWIAASDELFCYSPEFELIASYRNDYLRHRQKFAGVTSAVFDVYRV